MLSRILVILIGAPLLVYIFVAGNFSFLLFNLCVIGVGMYELYDILRRSGVQIYRKAGILLGLLLPILIYVKHDFAIIFKYLSINVINNISFDLTGYLVFCIMLIAILQIRHSKIKNSTNELLYTLFGIIYVSLFMSFSILIRYELNAGHYVLLYTFISIWFCDTFAYIVGLLIGGRIFKRRLSEKISPKKSIEGFIGGVLGVFIVGLLYEKVIYVITGNVVSIGLSNNLYRLLFLSTAIAIFSVLGDLFESKIKREFGVKDSGTILLGHGGFLDRFDSALFVLPVVYFIIKYIIF